MTNPWLKINWKTTVASCDSTIITPSYCSKRGIDTTYLPEPFSGNIYSNVVCLNLNPGIGRCDVCFKADKNFLKDVQEMLRQDLFTKTSKQFLWFKDIRCHKGVLHEGCEWWRKRTKDLVTACSPTPLNMLVLEYFPYHTQHAFHFPKLPSDEYRNDLLDKAMTEGKLIVIMRGEKQWYSIADRCIGCRLKSYPNLIVLSNPRSPYFSSKTIKSADWGRIVKELKKPI